MKRDHLGRPVCHCGDDVDPHYAICPRCKNPYSGDQILAAEQWWKDREWQLSMIHKAIVHIGQQVVGLPVRVAHADNEAK